MADQYIQFLANYSDWVAIKKLKIEDKTDPQTIMEFLAGLLTSVDRKIEENLRKTVDLDKLDAALAEISTGKAENEIAHVLKEVSSRKISSVINAVTALPSLQKNEQKEIAGFCRAYATRKLLKACNATIDYSQIEIPGMKRVMKKSQK